jgi:hypothetical protein
MRLALRSFALIQRVFALSRLRDSTAVKPR